MESFKYKIFSNKCFLHLLANCKIKIFQIYNNILANQKYQIIKKKPGLNNNNNNLKKNLYL